MLQWGGLGFRVWAPVAAAVGGSVLFWRGLLTMKDLVFCGAGVSRRRMVLSSEMCIKRTIVTWLVNSLSSGSVF
jgi:hypothetical protein